MEFLLPLIILVPLLLIITRTRKQQRQFQELQAQLQPGQAVVTSSGLHGRIHAIEGDVVVLDVADGVRLRWARAGIGQIVKSTPDAADVAGEETGATAAYEADEHRAGEYRADDYQTDDYQTDDYTADEYKTDDYTADEYVTDRAEDGAAGQPGRQRGA